MWLFGKLGPVKTLIFLLIFTASSCSTVHRRGPAQTARDLTCEAHGKGLYCTTQIAEYPLPVVFLFSNGEAKASNVVVHFHGNRTAIARDRDLKAIVKDMWFRETLDLSITDPMVIVIPESNGKNETHRSYFSDSRNWEEFMAAVFKIINKPDASLVLTAHSGGYLPVQAILKSKVFLPFAVALWDASYSGPSLSPPFEEWLKNNPHAILSNSYLKGSPTSLGAKQLLKTLPSKQYMDRPVDPQGLDHWSMVRGESRHFFTHVFKK